MNTFEVTKTATRRDHWKQPSFFYRSAREGMRDFLDNVLIEGRTGVLLPAFIGWSPREGSGVYDPVDESSAEPNFYRLNEDLTVDVDDLELRIAHHPCRVLVVIHYFGRTDPNLGRIRQIANENDMLLVEDLAHGLYSALHSDTAGKQGDVLLFSLHKMLPLASGGQVVYRNPSLISNQTSTMDELAGELASYDLHGISRSRRENFTETTRLLSASELLGEKFELIWPVLSGGDVPQTLPIRVLGGNRNTVYARMNTAGYGMVSLYHTLIEPVRGRFPVQEALASSITNFPVHQDVEKEEIEPMVNEFLEAISQD